MKLEQNAFIKGNNFLRYGCRQLTRFGVFKDRIMKLSGWAWFMISCSPSKFELISTTFFFKVSKEGPKEKCWKTNLQFFCIFSLVPPWKLWKKSCLNKLKFWEASWNHKPSSSWKFYNSILKNAKRSQLSASISEKVVPLCKQKSVQSVQSLKIALLMRL